QRFPGASGGCCARVPDHRNHRRRRQDRRSARSAPPLRCPRNGAHRNRRHATWKQILRHAVIPGGGRASHDRRRSLAVGVALEESHSKQSSLTGSAERNFRKDLDGYIQTNWEVVSRIAHTDSTRNATRILLTAKLSLCRLCTAAS